MFEEILKLLRGEGLPKNPLARASILVLVGIACIWFYWDKISPGVQEFNNWRYYSQQLHNAPPNKFSIAVVDLQHDDDRAIQKQIVSSLGPLDGAVNVIILPRILTTDDIGKSSALAQQWSTSYGFDVIIWGAVLRGGDRTLAQIYWTTRTNTIALPNAEPQDVNSVLGLVATTSVARLFDSIPGRDVSDHLAAFIGKTASLVDDPDELTDVNTRSILEVYLAKAKVIYGDERHDSGSVCSAIDRFRMAAILIGGTKVNRRYGSQQPGEACDAGDRFGIVISRHTADTLAQKLAMIENSLGNAYFILGQHEPGNDHLLAAREAYYSALVIRKQHLENPRDLASTEDGLGTVYEKLAEHEKGSKVLNARGIDDLNTAIAFYYQALQIRGKLLYPRDWASTKDGLATAFVTLANRTNNTKLLAKAAQTYEDALSGRPPGLMPRDRAWTENNIGKVYYSLSRRKGLTGEQFRDDLVKSLAAYQNALCGRNASKREWDETFGFLKTAMQDVAKWNRSSSKKHIKFLPSACAFNGKRRLVLSSLPPS